MTQRLIDQGKIHLSLELIYAMACDAPRYEN